MYNQSSEHVSHRLTTGVDQVVDQVVTQEPQAPSIPTIASSAMQVELSISQWTGRKQDKRASERVVAQSNADLGVANVHKKLLANCDELSAIHTLTGSARTLNYSMTLPWSDTGMRLIPTARFMDYHKQMTAIQDKWEDSVAAFLQSYEWEISRAEVSLGSLFNRDEYPTVSQLTNKFAFRLSYIELPRGDFRVDLPEEAVEQVKSYYKDYYERQFNTAKNDLWDRTQTCLTDMSSKLDYSDDDPNKKVPKSGVVNNVLKIIDMLRVYNLDNDSDMSAMRDRLENIMRGVTREALVSDETLRRETKREVDAAIAALPSLDI